MLTEQRPPAVDDLPAHAPPAPDPAAPRQRPASSSRLEEALRGLDVKDAVRALRERHNGGGE